MVNDPNDLKGADTVMPKTLAEHKQAMLALHFQNILVLVIVGSLVEFGGGTIIERATLSIAFLCYVHLSGAKRLDITDPALDEFDKKHLGAAIIWEFIFKIIGWIYLAYLAFTLLI